MRVHILGICGTFMAGLALLARELGFSVSGSDANIYPPMSTQLAAAGIEVLEGYHPEHLQPAPDRVLVGNAMTRGNPAVEYLLNSTIPYTSGPQWLAEHVLVNRWVLAVAGTHGKTSTSAMLAWILEHAGYQPGFLIGGVANDFSASARLGEPPFFVVEADEYDSAFFDKRSKFIHYRPRTLVLNNLEYDHADIFPDLASIQRQFHYLVRTVPGAGLIISNGAEPALEAVLDMGCWTPLERFVSAEWQVHDPAPDGCSFTVFFKDRYQGRVEWSQLGLHNAHNALAAIAAARHAGVIPAQAGAALAEFGGVKRRLELRGSVGGVSVYDDFAHHPTAIARTLAALRARVGKARIIAVLELRSNTMRMGIFDDQLPAALAQADSVIVQAPSQDSAATLATVLERVRPGDHVLIMSNGGFDNIHDRLLTALKK